MLDATIVWQVDGISEITVPRNWRQPVRVCVRAIAVVAIYVCKPIFYIGKSVNIQVCVEHLEKIKVCTELNEIGTEPVQAPDTTLILSIQISPWSSTCEMPPLVACTTKRTSWLGKVTSKSTQSVYLVVSKSIIIITNL